MTEQKVVLLYSCLNVLSHMPILRFLVALKTLALRSVQSNTYVMGFLFSNDMSFFIFFPTFCFCKFLNGKKKQKVLIYILKTDSLKVNWEMQLEFLNLFIFPSS